MDQLIRETATTAPVEPIMRDISMDEIEAVSGGAAARGIVAARDWDPPPPPGSWWGRLRLPPEFVF